MKQSEILMVRKKISDEWEGVIPGTAFLKKAISREEVGPGFWLVNDLEDKCWYVIDKPTGLMVTIAETRAKAKKNFDLIREKALQARNEKGYEEAKKRLLMLQDRPIWDPKEESEECLGKRLARWMKGIQCRYSPQGIEKVVFDEFVPEKDEK